MKWYKKDQLLIIDMKLGRYLKRCGEIANITHKNEHANIFQWIGFIDGMRFEWKDDGRSQYRSKSGMDLVKYIGSLKEL